MNTKKKNTIGWIETTLAEVVEFQRGFDLPTTKRTAGKYPLMVSNGQDGTHNEYKVVGPGIVTGRSGTIGEVFFVKQNFWPLNTTLWIKDFHNNDKKFVYYFLKTFPFQKYNAGSGVPTLNRNHIHPVSITIPPLPEQHAIAAVLSSLDDKIELLREQNKVLEEIAQSIFKEWFINFNFPGATGKMIDSELGEIPEGWRVGQFTEIIDILSGGTPKTDIPEYWNGSIPFFTPKDAKDTFYVINTEKTITNEGLKKCNSRLYSKNTVFITARGTVGKCVLASFDMAMNQSCYALSGKDIPDYFVFLLTKTMIENIQRSASGAVFDAITVQTFDSLTIRIPNTKLIQIFTATISPFFAKILSNLLQIQTLSSLRDCLLPRLMRGEVRVKNFNILT